MEEILPKLQEWGALYGLRVLGALAIFILGRWIAKGLRGLLRKLLVTRKVEPTLISFAANLTYAALVAFVVVATLNQLGVQTTSFVAIVGAAGLAIGLALQGSLANFASGVLIIIFRPFVVGELIEVAGNLGLVEDLDIFTTTLVTLDNKTIVIPNGQITSGVLVNYSRKDKRRVDMVIGVSYSDALPRVKEVIYEVLNAEERVLKDPAPNVAVSELGDSSVNFVVRPWVKTDDYWDVYFALTEAIKIRFDAEGICIPFPQRDVHLFPTGGAEESSAA